MPSINTGYKFSTISNAANVSGSLPANAHNWVNLGAISALGAANAAVPNAIMSAAVSISNWFVISNFAFNLPTGISGANNVELIGFELIYNRKFNPAIATNQFDVKTCGLSLWNNAFIGTDNGENTSWIATTAIVTVGSPTNLLGITTANASAGLTHNSTFGFGLRTKVSGTGGSGYDPALFSVQMRVWYYSPYTLDVSASPEFGYENNFVSLSQKQFIGSQNTTSEYGFELISNSFIQVPTIPIIHSQYGFEILSNSLKQNNIIGSQSTNAEFGFEALSDNLLFIALPKPNNSEYGYEQSNASFLEKSVFRPLSSEYGYETFSPIASRFPIIDIRSGEFGFESKSVLTRYFQYGNSSIFGRRIQREF